MPRSCAAATIERRRGQVAEVRVELREVLLPVAVVAVDVGVGVDVLDDGRDPQRRDAEGLEVVEVVLDALPVAALVLRERAGLDVEVVVHVAVGEAVDEELVDDLVAPVLHVRGEHGLLAVGGDLHAARLGREGGAAGEGEGEGVRGAVELRMGVLSRVRGRVEPPLDAEAEEVLDGALAKTSCAG